MADRPSEGTNRWALRRVLHQSVPHHDRRRLVAVGAQGLARRAPCLLRWAFKEICGQADGFKIQEKNELGWLEQRGVGFALIYEEDMSLFMNS